eukprot:m.109976 g.109976  ORF g.109976 m.109976 type:complete len:99 (+) comp12741_c1_seq16:285-581(+)
MCSSMRMSGADNRLPNSLRPASVPHEIKIVRRHSNNTIHIQAHMARAYEVQCPTLQNPTLSKSSSPSRCQLSLPCECHNSPIVYSLEETSAQYINTRA